MASLAQRFRLFTASDGFSIALPHALGVLAGLFERLYGPDLVNVPKQSGRAYYEAIFEHAGGDPAASIVVDDGAENLFAAREAGARTVLVSDHRDHGHDGPVIARLADLPAIIDAF
jgi:FMN phosphatase YigB (HAD superfamily)